jgi:hypothetical protein
MKHATGIGIGLWMVLAGCSESTVEFSRPAVPPDSCMATAAGDDLMVTLDLPKTTLAPGEQVHVSIIASNRTDQRLRIQAGSGAPYFVSLWRHTGTGWDKIKRYPVTSQLVLSEWYLPPCGARAFAPMVTVEPDWPRHELLRLQVEINGRGDVAPWVGVEVIEPEAPVKPAAPQADSPTPAEPPKKAPTGGNDDNNEINLRNVV